jgi:hypothetical protein
MARPYTCEQVWSLAATSSDVFTIDYTDLLGSGETLAAVSGTVTAGGITYSLGVTVPTGITAGAAAINSGSVVVNGVTIATSKAVQVRLSTNGATVGRRCSIVVVVSTSSGNVLPVEAVLEIIG